MSSTSRRYSLPKKRPSPLQRTSGWASRVFISQVVPDFASPTTKKTGTPSPEDILAGAFGLRSILSRSTVDPRPVLRRNRSAPQYLEFDTGILRSGSPGHFVKASHRRPYPSCSVGSVG